LVSSVKPAVVVFAARGEDSSLRSE